MQKSCVSKENSTDYTVINKYYIYIYIYIGPNSVQQNLPVTYGNSTRDHCTFINILKLSSNASKHHVVPNFNKD